MLTRSLPAAVVCLGLCVAVPQGAWAATPYLVKNINPAQSPASSNPDQLVSLGNGVDLFVADDGRDGRELWRTDGTAAGTAKVSTCDRVCSGNPTIVAVTPRGAFFTAGGLSDLWLTRGVPGDAVRLGGVGNVLASLWSASRGLLFAFNGYPTTGSQLWRSGGAPDGTYSLNVRQANAYRDLAELGGRVYFGGADDTSGPSLWRSDGTLAGTELFWTPGPALSGVNGPSRLRVAGGRLFFIAAGPDGLPAAWSTDGEQAPELIAGPGRAVDVAVFGDRVLIDSVTGEPDVKSQLWITDGTVAGTSLLTTLDGLEISATVVTDPAAPLPPGRFLFKADDGVHGSEPWITDGTPAGTHLLLDICPGSCGSASYFTHVQSAAGATYFGARDPARGTELWITDGTAAGTRFLKDLCPGPCSSFPVGFLTVNGKLVFTVSTATGNAVLWRTDGTRQGTVPITNLGPGRYPMVALNPSTLVIPASDPVHGTELWRTNGTAAGTSLVKDIASDNLLGSNPAGFMTAGGKLFFLATDAAHGRELWTSDGTGQGTHLVKDLTPGPGPQSWPSDSTFTEAGGKLFFLGFANNTRGLWKSDGTAAGTVLLTPGQSQTSFGSIAAVGKTVFFSTASDSNPQALWKSDGTVAGTVPVPGTPLASLGEFAPFHGRLFFFSNDVRGPELWSSDGTAAGTVLVKSLSGGVYVPSNPSHFTEHSGRLYFFADDSVHRTGLWRTDGTAAGTVLVADLAGGNASFTPHLLASTGTRLLMMGGNFEGEKLWSSDGTTAGTRQILAWPSPVSSPVKSAVFQGRLYFIFQGALWVSDGTVAGTAFVLDSAGHLIMDVDTLRALNHHVYFTVGRDPNFWQTDGTRAGTRPVPLPATGSMQVLGDLFQAGPRLFFQGQDAAAGRELWAIGPD